MALLKNILGFRDFAKIGEIKNYIRLFLFFDKEEDVHNLGDLLIFETSNQKTWLIASNLRLFCVLDDIGKDSFQVRWDLKRNEIITDGHITLNIRIREGYSQNSGSIDFGAQHKGWLYSKKLFPRSKKLIDAIHELIWAAMQ